MVVIALDVLSAISKHTFSCSMVLTKMSGCPDVSSPAASLYEAQSSHDTDADRQSLMAGRRAS
eukprot:9015448-Pyramimonas_sp.AAC.1